MAGISHTKYQNPCEVATPPTGNAGGRLAHDEQSSSNALETEKTGIYPNPNAGNFSISYVGNANQLNIEIYNTVGQIIINKQLAIENNNAITEINNLENGVYMVKLRVDGVTIRTERVIVTK